MCRYDKLADEVNGLSVSKAQGLILKSLEESTEKENILSKMQVMKMMMMMMLMMMMMQGAETTDIAEQNQILMLLLKASCEVQQDGRQCCGSSEAGGNNSVSCLTLHFRFCSWSRGQQSGWSSGQARGERDGGHEERQEVAGGELHRDDEEEGEH